MSFLLTTHDAERRLRLALEAVNVLESVPFSKRARVWWISYHQAYTVYEVLWGICRNESWPNYLSVAEAKRVARSCK